VIAVRRARAWDAPSIGAVHVAAWRSAYPTILPDRFLSRLSVPRQAAYYDNVIAAGGSSAVYVASVSGADLGRSGPGSRIVGFATCGRAARAAAPLADGEIETLYVLDDWRERGIGRRLIRAAALHLAEQGCRSAFLWVLRDNPSRWFYQRLGGRPAAEDCITVGGAKVFQTAYVWNPIDTLAQATSAAS
jgi:ribosomal protein S18 acetylase RimI-like enzyme